MRRTEQLQGLRMLKLRDGWPKTLRLPELAAIWRECLPGNGQTD